MNDQLLHLVFASARPHIGIRVVPVSAGPVPGMAGGFVLMQYAKPRPVVFLENDVTSLFLDGPAYVDQYRQILADWPSSRWTEKNRGRGLPNGQVSMTDRGRITMTGPGPAERRWRKSSFSGGSGDGNCVEVALDLGDVAVRDSKNAGGPVLAVAEEAWDSFLVNLLAR